MVSTFFKLAPIATFVFMLPAFAFAQNTYDINFTSNAPIVDGIISPGEWADAEPAEGNWRILRNSSGPLDTHNNRFQMTWDNTNLYLLATSDYGGWNTNSRDRFQAFNTDNINIYFDPNRDGEVAPGGPQLTPDGYQISLNQYVGTYDCTSCSTETDANPTNGLDTGEVGSNLSTYAEAHIDALFGNQGGWQGLRGTEISTVNNTSGGVVEMAIPWTDFDAPLLDANGLQSGLDLGGLAPVNGETWFFNIGQITTDASNDNPVWSWYDDPTGNEFFAAFPNGEVTFVQTAVPEPNSMTLLGLLALCRFTKRSRS